jgi:hypothetical protein
MTSLPELDRLEAEATKRPWTFEKHEPEMFGPTYTIEDASRETVMDDTQYYPTAPGLPEAKFLWALHESYPELRALIAKADAWLKMEDELDVDDIEENFHRVDLFDKVDEAREAYRVAREKMEGG